MPTDILSSLTETQQQAVRHVDGPLLILAGPGSGKTRVVTHRVAHLLEQGIPARQILALTFTNKAADEMKLRLQRLAPGENVWMGTFHRFGARLLRRYASLVGLAENYSIYDTQDAARVLKQAVTQALEDDRSRFTPEAIGAAIRQAKNDLLSPEQYQASSGNPLGAVTAKVYPVYQQLLLRANAADFDDLLMHVAVMLRENEELRGQLDERYRYILVDEYQDTNLAQYVIVRSLSVDHPNLAVTGDPDQSIYGWRGANLNNILDFERDYPKVRVVRLEQNWRSSKCILRAADVLIGHNRKRKKKELFTDNDEGRPVRLTRYENQSDEAQSIAAEIAHEIRAGRRRARDFAVFYRVNALSRSLEFAFRQEGVPFQLLNSLEFFQRKEIKDVLAYLQLVHNPRSDAAFGRIINTPPRGIGKKTVERLQQHAARYQLTMLEAAREAGLIESLSKRAAVAVARFVSLHDKLSELADGPIEQMLGHAITETGYEDALNTSDSEEDAQRLANIEELLNVAKEFDAEHDPPALEAFLEQTSLTSDTDDWETDTDKVSLMTLHSAKGLEFPAVYLIGIEQGLLPHSRSMDDDRQLEEERRLLFVGMTRAERELNLSLVKQRAFRGSTQTVVPSNFLMELPRDEFEYNDLPGALAQHFEPSNDYEEPSFDPAELEQMTSTSSGSKTGFTGLMTAAEMLGEKPAKPTYKTNAHRFAQGMMVSHPQYGLGKIVALSGPDRARTATVQFFSDPGEKKFRLAQSPLEPVSGNE